ncbi:cystathionine beta-lyase [Pseudoalteromonas luteoviolacea CPMOR-2]|uniref:Cystathionine beta-lyase n=1 Tax=Pseudoalteromonas luteoviolacea DSM 6061 TaxID=1365250 RepID=A0A166V6C1_9GAMM|nr:cystathionine beta-lyase [Pseudoalteromonas luteoviolacea]KZN31766.1 cystathionine beta-lyase [Pseudoalteromonas luteoviolacea DSM 6061]KZN54626.1 cystathionine beta-lyase [Pseudoalteromonas luteoviolacea CPMOR-2]MBE0389103.1 cystathionine beta-lyase [Pseudoalteromonas luteoviolacea DSM 6061]
MKKNTKLASAGRKLQYTQGVVNPVVQRASTVVFDSVADMHEAIKERGNRTLFYGRRGTNTHYALQDAITELENGAGCALYPSGAAAISQSLLSFLKAGDHLLMVDTAYEPTRDLCDKILAGLGISTTYYDPMIGAGVKALIQENTKVLFLESPGSITMEVQDVPALVQVAKENGLITMLDNTYGNGWHYRPLDHGVDISIQAATKYIVGHSDVMMGVAVANEEYWPTLREHSYLLGQCTSADDAYLALRGLRTMPVRLQQHEKSALTVANWLAEHPLVDHVRHPALPSNPGHEYFKRDFDGSNGLFSFVMKSGNQKAINRFLDSLHHFKMGFSWGGYESLVTANITMAALRTTTGWEHGPIIRLHIGLEDVEDLLADLEQALKVYESHL